jgi:hypothetical protein
VDFYSFFYWFFSGNKQKVNSTFGFPFWTFINVQNGFPYGAFEKDHFKMTWQHIGIKLKKTCEKCVIIKNNIFEKSI